VETSCAYQASAPSLWKSSTMLLLIFLSLSGVWHFSHMKTAMGTPQIRWREMVQSGRVAIMLEMRSCPHEGSQTTLAISSSVRWRKLVAAPSGAVIGVSMEMNHCSVARKMTGLWQRQQCG